MLRPQLACQEFLRFLKKVAAASVITRQAIRRGSFTSVKELTVAIGTFIDTRNDHPRPLTWTKDADEILASIKRARAKTRVGSC